MLGGVVGSSSGLLAIDPELVGAAVVVVVELMVVDEVVVDELVVVELEVVVVVGVVALVMVSGVATAVSTGIGWSVTKVILNTSMAPAAVR